MGTMAMLIAVLAALASIAWAKPEYYFATFEGDDERPRDGCQLPAHGYGQHKDPLQDASITFKATDSTGAEVSEYQPGSKYTITVNYGNSRTGRGIILADAGAMAPDKTPVGAPAPYCPTIGRRFSWHDILPEQNAEWTAPAAGTGDAKFSVNLAERVDASYLQSSFTIPEGASAPTPAPATSAPTTQPPTAAPTPAPATVDPLVDVHFFQWGRDCYDKGCDLGAVKVGDQVIFEVSGSHNLVKQLGLESYDTCDNSTTEVLHDMSADRQTANFTWVPTADDVGKVYFSCQINNHCAAKDMKAVIEVVMTHHVNWRGGGSGCYDEVCSLNTTVKPGEVVVFDVSGFHNLAKQFTEESYATCDNTTDGMVELVAKLGSGSSKYAWTVPYKSGAHYFACHINSHCADKGMKMVVNVEKPSEVVEHVLDWGRSAYDEAYSGHKVKAGDWVTFEIGGFHNLVKHDDLASYEVCAPNTTSVVLSPNNPGVTTDFVWIPTDADVGLHYFACHHNNHCSGKDMKAVIEVVKTHHVNWRGGGSGCYDEVCSLNTTVKPGEVVVFDVSGFHNLAKQFTEESYATCDNTTDGMVELVAKLGSGSSKYAWTVPYKSGAHYFACHINSHCADRGMKMVVNVEKPSEVVEHVLDWGRSAYDEAYSGHKVKAGDWVTFEIGGFHNLVKHDDLASYEVCAPNTTSVVLSPNNPGVTTDFVWIPTDADVGLHYFACHHNNHCSGKDMKAVIEVVKTHHVNWRGGGSGCYDEVCSLNTMVKPGEVVVFDVSGFHNLAKQFTEESYATCDNTTDGMVELVAKLGSGSSKYAWTVPYKSGAHYFACHINSHCADRGMKMVVNVEKPSEVVEHVLDWGRSAYDEAYSGHKVKAGDWVTFEIGGFHNLVKHDDLASYEVCAPNTTSVVLSPNIPDVTTDFVWIPTDADVGLHYFACHHNNHCSTKDMKAVIEVVTPADYILSRINLPAGAEIKYYAQSLPNARSFAVSKANHGPKTIVYVSTRKLTNIYALVDDESDGVVDSIIIVADNSTVDSRPDISPKGFNSPNGIAWRQGSLYVAQINAIWRFDNVDEHALAGTKFTNPTLVLGGLPDDASHGWKFLRFDKNQEYLYFCVGAPCNICETPDPVADHYYKMHRVRYDGTGFEEVAWGVRQSVGMDFHPVTNALWFTDNGRDSMGDDLPDDKLNVLPNPGASPTPNYGYPHCHSGGVGDPWMRNAGEVVPIYDPDVNDESRAQRINCNDTSLATGIQYAKQPMGPHIAALGMRFLLKDHFPEEYHGDIIIAQRGSWDRNEKIGYRVVRVKLDSAGENVEKFDVFADGWLDRDTQTAYGRPVDVEELPDGSLLISDDTNPTTGGGAVYRVTFPDRPFSTYTFAPTNAPVSAAPTNAPVSAAPTNTPTSAPVTSPTAAPATSAPVAGPAPVGTPVVISAVSRVTGLPDDFATNEAEKAKFREAIAASITIAGVTPSEDMVNITKVTEVAATGRRLLQTKDFDIEYEVTLPETVTAADATNVNALLSDASRVTTALKSKFSNASATTASATAPSTSAAYWASPSWAALLAAIVLSMLA